MSFSNYFEELKLLDAMSFLSRMTTNWRSDANNVLDLGTISNDLVS